MAKVLFIINGYPDISSSANIFVKNQADSLKKNGIDIGVMVVDIRSIRRLRRYGIYRKMIDNIPICYISFPWGGFFPGFAQKIYNVLGELGYRHIVKSFGKPDIIHAHFGGSGIIGAKLKKKFHLPLVITEHSSLMLPHSKKLRHKKRVLSAYDKCDKLIAVSTSLVKNIEMLGAENVILIPNIIPQYYFARKKDIISKKKKQFISVGYLQPNKRFDLLISAFKRLSRIHNDSTLLIIGDGPLYGALLKSIRQIKLENKISLCGYVKNTELPQLYRESICFALPSEYETFGVVYAEALASGIPVIATDCGGPTDIVNETNGIIIKKNDEDALFEAMEYMYTNFEKFDPEILIENCRKQFDEKSVTEKILTVYRDVLNVNNLI